MQVAEETFGDRSPRATDARARARLRVELAGRRAGARSGRGARGAGERGARGRRPTQALTLAAIAMARTLPPPERVTWLSGLAPPARAAAVPEHRRRAGGRAAATPISRATPRRTLLALVRDERLPLHHRRAAASRLVRICDRVDPILGRTALHAAAMLAPGKARRRAVAAGAGVARDDRTRCRPASPPTTRRSRASCSSGRSAGAIRSWPPIRWRACACTSTHRRR